MIRSFQATFWSLGFAAICMLSPATFADDPVVVGTLDTPNTPDNLSPGTEYTNTVRIPARVNNRRLDQTTVGLKIVDSNGDLVAGFGGDFGDFESIQANGNIENPESWTFTFKATLPLISSAHYFVVGTGVYDGVTTQYGPFPVSTGD